MALSINGRMKVKTLKADFLNEFGLTLRVYDGRSFADDHATLASIRKGDSKGGEFAPKRNTKVGNLEDKIMEMFGIKTQVAGSDDSYLCDNDLTLAGALEADEKKMAKKVKKTENKTETTDDAVVAETESAEETRELTDEEKNWLEDLYNLDEAPEAICASKAFMLEAVKEDGSSLEYASDALKNDKEVVLEAVKESSSALEYISDELKNDKEIVMLVIKEDGSSLEYASDALKGDKDVVLLAIQNNASALEYASDTIKSDKKLAIEFIQSLNEKNKDPENSYIDVDGIENLAPSVFSEVSVVEEMVKQTPHEFIARLMYRNDKDKEVFEILKQFNNMIAPAVKKEFEEDMASIVTIVNNDGSVSDKNNYVDEILKKYDMENLVYSPEFELKKFPESGYTETLLWIELRKRVEDEVLSPLAEQASSFGDYNSLIMLLMPYGTYTLYTDNSDEKTKLREFYEKLIEHLDEADSYDLGHAYVVEEWFDIADELPDVASKIMNKLGEKLLDMDIKSALGAMGELEYTSSSLPDNVKSELLQRTESLSDDEKEELYLDEIIEYLGQDEDNE